MWKRYVLVALALVASACRMPQSAPVPPEASEQTAPSLNAGTTPGAVGVPPSPAIAGGASTLSGVVAETMNSGGYTYARLTAKGADTWIASNEFALAVGDQVTATVNMPMEHFRSRTLNRDFALIYFVSQVSRNSETLATAAAADGAPAMMGSHGGADSAATPAPPPLVARVELASGGVTIADVWARRAVLSGKPVVLRGQVVKANYEIMGTNWYRLQDGSGAAAAGTHDLVVTSSVQVTVGDVVTVSGALSTGKDFGAGYTYDAIVEKAQITK